MPFRIIDKVENNVSISSVQIIGGWGRGELERSVYLDSFTRYTYRTGGGGGGANFTSLLEFIVLYRQHYFMTYT